jgi:WD40 repeat protein/molecular chaperone DnaK (HSP70)
VGAPYVGIDFGTTYSSMAWYNPGGNPPYSGQAEVILNSDGEPKTPSTVYFGEDETLVGRMAERILEDASEEQDQRDEVFQRTVRNIKRELITPPQIALPGSRFVRPVEVAAEILEKLKVDAEDGVFHEEVPRAVITCPAEFGILQRQVIERAGRLAGFEEVVLLDEPVAGALAYARSGRKVGKHVLVYDLGGGTFDLAVLDNEGESFHTALEPKGIDKCGGEDFDLVLYYHCDEVAREKLDRPVSLTGTLDLKFLRECRERKENLSIRERVTVSSLLPGSVVFRHQLDREKFNELIADYVETTVRLTEAMVKEAEDDGHKVDTVVLIGGSSNVLLVRDLLSEALPVPPLAFDRRDFAVALGAAHYAHLLWDPPPEAQPTLIDTDGDEEVREPAREILDQYRNKVIETTGPNRMLNRTEIDRLEAFATQLALNEEQIAAVEQEVLGEAKEAALLRRYREAVEMVWNDGRLSGLEARWLGALADELDLDRNQAAGAEREVMSVTKEEIEPAPRPEPPDETGDFILGLTLEGHSGRVDSVAYTPNGKFLASGGSDNTVRGWNLDSGQSVGTLSGPLDRITSVALSPTGGLLAGGGFDKMIRVWKLPRGEPLNTLNHSQWVWSIAISPDGQILASGGADKMIRLWNLETGELLSNLSGHSHWVLSVAIGRDGRILASGGADGSVRVWELEVPGRLLRTLEHSDWVWSVGVSLDGRLIAGGSDDGAIKVWESETGEVLHTIRGHKGPVSSVALSPDGELLFSGGADGRIKVWSVRTGELLNILPGHSGGVEAIAISPDGQQLASGGLDHSIKIWDKQSAPEQANQRPSEPAGGSLPLRPKFLPGETRPGPHEPQDLPDLPPGLPD